MIQSLDLSESQYLTTGLPQTATVALDLRRDFDCGWGDGCRGCGVGQRLGGSRTQRRLEVQHSLLSDAFHRLH